MTYTQLGTGNLSLQSAADKLSCNKTALKHCLLKSCGTERLCPEDIIIIISITVLAAIRVAFHKTNMAGALP